ncbi:uncharacterized protein [Miscanthus floridulus]|uniref:uncharacterized protein isoform X1 n=1 Tax=Miscanthus floridulus TaxID=154761 RepID=UPI0034593D07
MATEEGSGGGGAGAGEKKSSQAPAKPGAGGAGKFLAGLPWRGNFSSGSGSGSSNLGGFRVYVCEHSTDPPEGQVIKTDSTNILIRHLQLNKQRSEGKDADSRTPGENNRGKRKKGRTQCRELPLCAGSGEGCQWQALPLPVQCEESVTQTRDLLVTGDLLPEVWMSTIQQRGLTWVLPLDHQPVKKFLAFHSTHCNHLQWRGYVHFYDKVVYRPKGKRMN